MIKQVYAAPKPVGVFSRVKDGITVFKGADGLRYMLIVTSNSYKDRDNEAIATKALNEYVEAAWAVEDKCLPENPLLVWHDGDPIGDIVWTDMEGPFLLEVAKERSNKAIALTGDKFVYHTTIKAVWNALERTRKRFGASHGFRYRDGDMDNGVYKQIRKFETSVLPLDAAANPYTFMGVVNDMNKDKVLEDLLKTPGIADKFRKGIRSVKGELDKRGLEHKAKSDLTVGDDETATGGIAAKGKLDEALSVIDAALAKIGATVPDGFSAQILQQLVATMGSGDTSDPATDEAYMEEDAADELPPKEEDAAVVSSKQVAFFARLIKSQETLAESAIEQMGATKQLTEEFKTARAEISQVNETVKGVPSQVKSLTDRLDAIEKRLSGAPRRAAVDATTVVDDKELTQKAREQVEKVEELFPGSGIKVKAAQVPPSNNGKG
jgi:phage shock protein A